MGREGSGTHLPGHPSAGRPKLRAPVQAARGGERRLRGREERGGCGALRCDISREGAEILPGLAEELRAAAAVAPHLPALSRLLSALGSDGGRRAKFPSCPGAGD